ncbi:MAG: tetratricopeptide repeat protein [Rhodobacteraceae bacterium]|nr:tetratricopeptide repeat protein [Paracoccaceae bacterium]
MEMPNYQLRLTSARDAKIFRVGFNNQKRITWSLCAQLFLPDGKITMLDGKNQPNDLAAFCDDAIKVLAQALKDNICAFDAILHMGKLAEEMSSFAQKIDDPLFELLIWSEADLKNGLVANQGLARISDDDQEKFILQGNQFLNQGKPAEAEKQFLIAQKLSGNEANINNFLAQSLAGQGKAVEAAKTMALAVQKKPKNVGFLFRSIQLQLVAGNLSQAEKDIEAVSKFSGLTGAQTLQLSRLALRAGLADLGLELVENAVKDGPWDAELFEHLINVSVGNGGEAKVFPIIRKYITKTPESPRIKQWWIRTLIHDGELEKAEEAAHDWTSSAPNDWQAWFQTGRVFFAQKKPRRALRAFEKSVGLDSKNAQVFKLIADACISLADLDGAKQASDTACALDSGNKNFATQAKHIAKLRETVT